MLMTMVVCAVGCNKDDDSDDGNNNNSDVRVTTYMPQDISQTSAKCGGDAIVTQGLSLTELGVCWGTERNPTAEDSHLSTTNWSEPYVCTITGLNPGTSYHVRAYAMRNLEYYFGEDKNFITEVNSGNSDVHVTTYTPQNITQTSAVCGGDAIVTQGLSLLELGVCWGIDSNPTAENSHLSTTNWSDPYVCTITGLTPGTNYHVRAYALCGQEYYYGEEKTFATEEECDCNLTSGNWVDLGLPSGLLWATRNVGASSPTDYGKYIAWGETRPKSIYNWDSYKYGYLDNNGNLHLTKYNTKSGYGPVDNLTTLQQGDDAATVNYGGRMPTKEEWQELYNNTTSRWVTINGVKGRCFTGLNGNSLFLPAAGYRDGKNLYNVGRNGNYWSSTLRTDDPSYAWDFFFNSASYHMYNSDNRSDGVPVRPVREN